MSTILDEIVEYKRKFVEEIKHETSIKELKARLKDAEDTRNFAEALTGEGCSLIAEIKTASPSRGIIREYYNLLDIANTYQNNGAACISILTDQRYFRGNLARIPKVRRVTVIPLLRKDFIIDEYQIYESRVNGADAILLIAACLSDSELSDFLALTHKLNMDAIVEVHNHEEMERAAVLKPKIIGINNRNLKSMDVSLKNTQKLAKYAPQDTILVSESGIEDERDVKKVNRMGAHAVLVGEALMREHDIGAKVLELVNATKRV
jgi:indole-3-glycerol phosphate synthase